MRFRRAFTIVELLTVIAVIAILLGLLIPSMNMARNAANVAKQKVQIASIDKALLLFRDDYGDYPPSAYTPTGGEYYCGAQKLAEALFGLDLLGFNPDTLWDAGMAAYISDTLADRKPRYLELDSVDVVNVSVYYDDPLGQLVPDTYVICDVFGHRKLDIGTKQENVGMPVLYFKADPSKFVFSERQMNDSVYNLWDNLFLLMAQMQYEEDNDTGREHPIVTNFYRAAYKLYDTRITTKDWPHRPDSYILISAGLDGEFGTDDDITNFGK